MFTNSLYGIFSVSSAYSSPKIACLFVIPEQKITLNQIIKYLISPSFSGLPRDYLGPFSKPLHLYSYYYEWCIIIGTFILLLSKLMKLKNII